MDEPTSLAQAASVRDGEWIRLDVPLGGPLVNRVKDVRQFNHFAVSRLSWPYRPVQQRADGFRRESLSSSGVGEVDRQDDTTL